MMMKKLILKIYKNKLKVSSYFNQLFCLFALLFSTIFSQNNVLYIQDGSGSASLEENSIGVILANEDTIAGFQFDIQYDPEAINLQNVLLTNTTEGMDLFFNESELGQVTIIVTSFSGEVIYPSYSKVIDIKFNISQIEQLEASYIELSNIALSKVSGITGEVSSADGYLVPEGVDFMKAHNGISSTSVSLYNSFDVAGLQLTLSFDPSLVVLENIIPRARSLDMDMAFSEPSPGTIVLIFYSLDQNHIGQGVGPLFDLYFENIVEQFSIMPIMVSDVTLSDLEGVTREIDISNGTFFIMEDLNNVFYNEPPEVENIEISLIEDTEYVGSFMASDPDEDSLSFIFTTSPMYGTLYHSQTENSNFIYVPDINFFGEDAFNFVAYDDSVFSDTASVFIIVQPINDPPISIGDSSVFVLEDESIEFEMIASDVDDDILSFVVLNEPLHGHYDESIYTPYHNYNGIDTLSYIAIDTSGLESEIANVIFFVTSINDEIHVENYIDTIVLIEDFNDVLSFDLDTVFVDDDGLLNYAVELTDSSVVAVEIVQNILSLNSLADANGTTQMILTASNPIRSSISDTVTIVVEAVNDPPSIAVVDTSMFEDDYLPIKIVASDVDNDNLEFLSVHFEPETLGGYFFGQNEDSLMVQSLIENWYGDVTVRIGVSDGNVISQGQFTISVLPVNDAPYFSNPMELSVGIELEFDLPLELMDVDSDDLVVNLVENEENPSWVVLNENVLQGIPDSLGYYDIQLSLTDGQISILDTIYLNVVNFKPNILSIEDIPNDQGSEVYVCFQKSFFDNGTLTNQSYDVYRLDDIEGEEDWVLVQSGSAIGTDIYYFQVPTIIDSSIHSDGLTQFRVIASMNNGIFSSEPSFGYSVDNIIPSIPTGMTALSVDNYISISWDSIADEDFQYYQLKRSGESGEDIVIDLEEAVFEDFNIETGVEYAYSIASYDYSGNFSGFSEPVLVSMLSSEQSGIIPSEFAIHQNYPNPFNPFTLIRYQLPEQTNVTISIYDLMGRSVRTLIPGESQKAGYRQVLWNATNDLGQPVSAGMYIYTIQAGEFRQTKKMVLMK